MAIHTCAHEIDPDWSPDMQFTCYLCKSKFVTIAPGTFKVTEFVGPLPAIVSVCDGCYSFATAVHARRLEPREPVSA